MSNAGHNSKAKGPISADRLKSFIERIEKLEEERKAIGGDVKDVYSEAKGVGYDVKTMRKIVQLRAMDSADRAEAETLLDTYCHALGMVYSSADYASEDALVEQASRIVSEVDRCMDLVADGQPPGIYAIQGLIGCSAGKASKLRGMVADRISRSEAKVREMKSCGQPDGGSAEVDADETVAALGPHDPTTGEVIEAAPTAVVTPDVTTRSILPSPSAWASVTAVRDAHEAAAEAAREAKREARRQELARRTKLAALTDSDMPDLPDFLDRRPQAQEAGA